MRALPGFYEGLIKASGIKGFYEGFYTKTPMRLSWYCPFYTGSTRVEGFTMTALAVEACPQAADKFFLKPFRARQQAAK